nr:unnamed protein product [Digitaria exilis]
MGERKGIGPTTSSLALLRRRRRSLSPQRPHAAALSQPPSRRAEREGTEGGRMERETREAAGDPARLGGARAAATRAEVASELEMPSTPRRRTQAAPAFFFLATTSCSATTSSDSSPPTLDPRGNRRWGSRGKGGAASTSVEEQARWRPRPSAAESPSG